MQARPLNLRILYTPPESNACTHVKSSDENLFVPAISGFRYYKIVKRIYAMHMVARVHNIQSFLKRLDLRLYKIYI